MTENDTFLDWKGILLDWEGTIVIERALDSDDNIVDNC